ncbi:MAG: hypothetical protein LBD48_12025 [Treponema sp.]|jgi:hypothetical protein|nr:hypothetical protein [Treponema sp.]
MREILIPELIVAFFLMLFFLRPFLKGLWPLDGLVWLPLLGMGITIAIFPAYGFRPECVPLLFFEFLLNLINIPALTASAVSRPADDFHDRSPVFTLAGLLLIGGALFVMFVFSPKIAPGLVSEGIEIREIQDKTRNKKYFLRIYRRIQTTGSGTENRPLLFLVPPETGSIAAVDQVCAALRDKGFTVISYSGESRGPDWSSPGGLIANGRTFRAGTTLKKANDRGKALESERQGDIEFLLPHISAFAGNGGGDAPLFLAGYGAGGSALVLLTGTFGFAAQYPQVKGIIALESRLWSVYRHEPPVFPELPAEAPWHLRLQTDLTRRLAGLKSRRISGIGPLPTPGLPLLCLVSDRAIADGIMEENPYQALLRTVRGSPNPAVLAAIEGAGPLDYSDYPLTNPVYSFLFQGQARETEKSLDPAGDTAGIICNFAASLIPSLQSLRRQKSGVPLYLETRGLSWL